MLCLRHSLSWPVCIMNTPQYVMIISIIAYLLILIPATSFISPPTPSISQKITLPPLYSSDDPSSSPTLSRRQIGELTVASIGGIITYYGTSTRSPSDYPLWGVLPLGPYKRKKTILTTVVTDKIWTLEQKFGILNVQVPLRMTVVKLEEGGLLIYNPVACTEELQSLLEPIIKTHGSPKYVILGTVALEHKVYAGIFAQKYPRATGEGGRGAKDGRLQRSDSSTLPTTISKAGAKRQRNLNSAIQGDPLLRSLCSRPSARRFAPRTYHPPL